MALFIKLWCFVLNLLYYLNNSVDEGGAVLYIGQGNFDRLRSNSIDLKYNKYLGNCADYGNSVVILEFAQTKAGISSFPQAVP